MLDQALVIAKSILEGQKDPNKGCSELDEINCKLDWPAELSAFALLAHEQYDHEHIGITAENCVSDIKSECKKLIEKLS